MPSNKETTSAKNKCVNRRQYVNYSIEMLNIAVNLVKSKKLSSYEAEKQFGIPRRTILNKVNQLHEKSIGHPTRLTENDEKQIADTVKIAADFGSPLSLLDLRIVVYHYLEKNDKSHIFNGKMPGERWARNFLARHKLTKRTPQNVKRARASKSVSELSDYFKNIEHSIQNISPSHILNYDETNLSDDPGCTKAIFKKGTKHPEVVINSSKSSVSIMFAGTADGTCLPPYVVYKSEHLWSRWCQGGPPGCLYNRTKSGWFDMTCFEDWFDRIVLPWAIALEGPKVIIGDNLSSHLSVQIIKLCSEYNIRFVFLPRNATHLTQPLDLAFFGPMKKHWRKIMLQYKLSNPNVATINKCHFPQLLKQLMEKLQVSGAQNLRSGFMSAGIFPFNPSKVITKIPEVTEQMTQTFDQTLLEYFKAPRGSKPMAAGRNYKLQVTAGKAVCEEDILAPKNIVKDHKQAKRSIKPAKVTLLSDLGSNKENNVSNEFNMEISPKLKVTNQDKTSKITILSDVRFSKDNTSFYGVKNAPLNLVEVDKNCDISLAHRSNQNHRESITQVITNISVHGSLSNSESDEETYCSDKITNHKRSLLHSKQSIKKKGYRKCKRILSSSTSNTDIALSEHDDSDLCDILSDEIIENFVYEPKFWSIHADKTDDQLKEMNEENVEINAGLQKTDDLKGTNKTDNDIQKELYDDKVQFNVGDTVLTRYYIRKSWKYYIGVIENIYYNPRRYLIVYYKTNGKKEDIKFIKPKRIVDKDTVPEDSIVKVVQLLQIRENPDEYVLMEDEDYTFFL